MIVLKDVMTVTPLVMNRYGEESRGVGVDYPCQFTGVLDKIEAIKSVALNGVFELKSVVWTKASVPVNRGDSITIKKVSGIRTNIEVTVVGVTHAGKYKGLMI